MNTVDILEYPDARLRQRSQEVVAFDERLREDADRLLDHLYRSGGIGLSAPQLGDLRRLVVMDLSGERADPQVFVNPEILAADEVCRVEESCLSLPGVLGVVERRRRVRVRALDVAGRRFERDLEDMHAVCLQHELDHLDGRLFIDRLPVWQRHWLRLRLRLQGSQGGSATRTPAESPDLSPHARG